MEQHPKRLTKLEVVPILRISLGTLDKRIKDGDIKIVREGKRIFILEDELIRYMRQS